MEVRQASSRRVWYLKFMLLSTYSEAASEVTTGQENNPSYSEDVRSLKTEDYPRYGSIDVTAFGGFAFRSCWIQRTRAVTIIPDENEGSSLPLPLRGLYFEY